jgi:hypothetical protein
VALIDVCDCDRDMQAGIWSAEPLANPKPLQGFHGQITFRRKFAVAPVVIVWLTGFDFLKGKNFRIKAEATNVTATGFNINVATWYDSVLYWASASWIAYDPDSPRIKFRVVQYHGCAAVGQAAAFGLWPGQVRWEAISASDVTKEGFKWHNDFWSDTVKYALGASYIALDVGPSPEK